MNYLFVDGSIKDKGGLAMIQGAMNGISFLDETAKFVAVVDKGEEGQHPGCPVVPSEEGFNFADVVLAVGGRCHDSDKRRQWVNIAKKKDLPFIWMSQSYAPNANNKDFYAGTIPIARGENAACFVQEVTNQKPVVAADLSFLVRPNPWGMQKYDRGYTTHFKKLRINWKKYLVESAVQIVWKEDETRFHEPKLPIKQYTGTVEDLFGMVAAVGAMYTARYQAACAAILAGKPLMILNAGVNAIKYFDLKTFRKMNKQELRASAMLSCITAVNAYRTNPWT